MNLCLTTKLEINGVNYLFIYYSSFSLTISPRSGASLLRSKRATLAEIRLPFEFFSASFSNTWKIMRNIGSRLIPAVSPAFSTARSHFCRNSPLTRSAYVLYKQDWHDPFMQSRLVLSDWIQCSLGESLLLLICTVKGRLFAKPQNISGVWRGNKGKVPTAPKRKNCCINLVLSSRGIYFLSGGRNRPKIS